MQEPFAQYYEAEDLGLTGVKHEHMLRASIRIRTYLRSVNQPTEFDPVPDDLVELTCQVAARMAAAEQSTVAGGVQQQQETAGPFQRGVTYGWDSYKATSGLSAGEVETLKRMFPPIPKTHSLGPAATPTHWRR